MCSLTQASRRARTYAVHHQVRRVNSVSIAVHNTHSGVNRVSLTLIAVLDTHSGLQLRLRRAAVRGRAAHAQVQRAQEEVEVPGRDSKAAAAVVPAATTTTSRGVQARRAHGVAPAAHVRGGDGGGGGGRGECWPNRVSIGVLNTHSGVNSVSIRLLNTHSAR